MDNLVVRRLTGYRLQQLLREKAHERDLEERRFSDSLKVFPGDPILHDPRQCALNFAKAERQIALLQAVQSRYNERVNVTVLGQQFTLLELVKMVGPAGRLEKMWRMAAFPKKDYFANSDTRDASALVAKRTISVDEAAVLSREAATWASALREAIGVANATEIDLEVDDTLFEGKDLVGFHQGFSLI